jgi:DNA-nicking Smr family endonuclease
MPQRPSPSVDLHGLHPDAALRRLAQALHTARVQGAKQLLVITGRGLGNRAQVPVLRGRVEAWLRGPHGRALGVRGLDRARSGGALEVHLGLRDPRT